MLIGDQFTFAIESGTTRTFERLSFRALGFFVIHIAGRAYGVHEPDASMLACSFDTVQERISRRGTHLADPFANVSDAGAIADAFRHAEYAPDHIGQDILGIHRSQLLRQIHSNHLVWAPDGDEAFDDGSYVLQFDVGNRVRVIGYKVQPSDEDFRHDPATLTDQWLDADQFYETLKQWHAAFHAEWLTADKVAE